MHIDCNSLRGRRRDVCRGYDSKGHSTFTEDERRQWLLHWGYVPDLVNAHLKIFPARTVSTDDPDFPHSENLQLASLFSQKPLPPRKRQGCGGCAKRRDFLNKLIPGAGDAVEALATVTGVKKAVDYLADRKERSSSDVKTGGDKTMTTWSYGVTTVPQRLDDLLPRTLASLAEAGFDAPRLFVDGAEDVGKFSRFGLEVTTRFPSMRLFGNWVLSLWELYIREPAADRYAIFQDDLVTYRNLRQYLDRCEYPERGYWNLYTFPENLKLVPSIGQTGRREEGWYLSNQYGRGAVGLVFSREAVTTLLGHQHMIDRPQDSRRGWRAIDGGIVTAFKKAGWKEYIHNPSLVQHTGLVSAMKNKPHKQADSFQGEDFDALNLINEVDK